MGTSTYISPVSMGHQLRHSTQPCKDQQHMMQQKQMMLKQKQQVDSLFVMQCCKSSAGAVREVLTGGTHRTAQYSIAVGKMSIDWLHAACRASCSAASAAHQYLQQYACGEHQRQHQDTAGAVTAATGLVHEPALS